MPEDVEHIVTVNDKVQLGEGDGENENEWKNKGSRNGDGDRKEKRIAWHEKRERHNTMKQTGKIYFTSIDESLHTKLCLSQLQNDIFTSQYYAYSVNISLCSRKCLF